MEPKNNQMLLSISLFSVIIFFFNSAQAIRPSSLSPSLSPADAPIIGYMSATTLRNFPPTQEFIIPPSIQISSAPAPTLYRSSDPPTASPQPQDKVALAPAPGLGPNHNDSAPSAANPAIVKQCKTTDYPDICLTSITPFLNGKTDPVSMLEIAINACEAHVNMALTTATKLSLVASSDMPLSDCKEIYGDALDNLKSAMDAIRTHDTGTLNTMLSAALTDFGTCQDGLTDAAAGPSSPLTSINDKGTKLASNCLAFASLVK